MIYGIDLGTTYSCVAYINRHGEPAVLPNAYSEFTTPSVVYFEEDDEHFVVGNVAKNSLRSDPERTVSLIKREMGKSYTKPTRFPRGLTPVEISACILKQLVEEANNAQDGSPCHDVVITCPAYFGAVAREQTKQAGEIAGLNVRRIVSEPTAAALAYGAKTENEDGKDRYVLVYDLGGGTFDITLIRIRGKVFKVLATGGDRELGGADWDLCLAEKLLEKFNANCQKHLSFEGNLKLKNHFLLEAEKCKKFLTAKAGVTAQIGWEGKSCEIFISRTNFEQWTRPLLDKTITLFMDLLKKAEEKCGFKISPDNTKILLVGGSSRMPQVRSRLDDVILLDLNCGNVEILLDDPDQCVAKGAALVGDICEEFDNPDPGPAPDPGETKPRTPKVSTFHDVTPKTYGTDVLRDGGEQVRNLIFANDSLPASASAMFKTVNDNQKMLNIKIFESDSGEKYISPADADLLDDDHPLHLPLGLPAKTECKVCFELDAQGMLHVRAYLVKTGEEIKFDVEVKGILSPDEIEKAKQEVDQSTGS